MGSVKIWPWSFLYRNLEAYYLFFKVAPQKLTEKQAEGCIRKICANKKKLAAAGIEIHKSKGGNPQFKI